MDSVKKWLYKYNEAGFINKEYEKLEKILMIGTFIIILLCFVSLVLWTINEATV